MKAFPSRLKLDMLAPDELGGGKQTYVLLEDFTYESALLGMLIVPAGFTTDFASIPRIAWRYIDPEDPCVAYPSVVHDFLYSMKGGIPGKPKYTREQADQVLREAMEICGARLDQRVIVYRMVRIFGGSHWTSSLP